MSDGRDAFGAMTLAVPNTYRTRRSREGQIKQPVDIGRRALIVDVGGQCCLCDTTV